MPALVLGAAAAAPLQQAAEGIGQVPRRVRPGQRPDVLGHVVVAEAHRVGIAERPLPDLGAGPHADTGQRAQLRRP